MKRNIITILVGLIFLILSTNLYSQENVDKEKGPEKPERARNERDRKNFRKKMRLMAKLEMLEELNLTEEQQDKLIPLVKQFEKNRDSIFEDMKKTANELNEELDKTSPDKAKISSLIAKLKESRTKLYELHNNHLKEVEQILSVEDQARYILLPYKMKQKVREFVRERRRSNFDDYNDRPRNPRETWGDQGYRGGFDDLEQFLDDSEL